MTTAVPQHCHKPDFDNFVATLKGLQSRRPVLGEFFINNMELLELLAGRPPQNEADETTAEGLAWTVEAWRRAGYDYATVLGSKWSLAVGEQTTKESRSLNQGAVITDEESLRAYEWNDPAEYHYSTLKEAENIMPDGMRLIARCPTGILEYAEDIIGYENLCFLLVDNPDLVREVFDGIGSRLLRYYEMCLAYPAVGAILVNDDWGFNSQTMLSPPHLRELVFPWHKRIVETAHAAGRPAFLHSCGNLSEVMDDIVDNMGYDAKHSFEDSIAPVEEMWDDYHDRVGIVGGLDMDFLVRGSPEAIRERARTLLKMTADSGRYALGTGNSVPSFMPIPNYSAILEAAYELW